MTGDAKGKEEGRIILTSLGVATVGGVLISISLRARASPLSKFYNSQTTFVCILRISLSKMLLKA